MKKKVFISLMILTSISLVACGKGKESEDKSRKHFDEYKEIEVKQPSQAETNDNGETQRVEPETTKKIVYFDDDGNVESVDLKDIIEEKETVAPITEFQRAKLEEEQGDVQGTLTSTDDEDVEDILGILDEVKFKAVSNRINTLFKEGDYNIEEFRLLEKPSPEELEFNTDTDTDTDTDTESNKNKVYYYSVGFTNYRYYVIAYYPDEGAVSTLDVYGILYEEYGEKESDYWTEE